MPRALREANVFLTLELGSERFQIPARENCLHWLK